jgi:hypothetical protein
MPSRLKFKPKITRVKLNPEQAVLTCVCYSGGYDASRTAANRRAGGSVVTVCNSGGSARVTRTGNNNCGTSGGSYTYYRRAGGTVIS